MSSVFKHTVEFAASMPFSVTNAVNIITAIANRNDTPARFVHPELGMVVHLDLFAVAALFGTGVAFKHHEAMLSPAVQMYFRKLDEKLANYSITLTRGEKFWVLSRILRDGTGATEPGAVYSLQDLCEQRPNGVALAVTPLQNGKPAEHSIDTGKMFVTVTLVE